MPSDSDELRALLKDAEQEIEQMRSEADEYITAIGEMAEGQTALEMQILDLNTQIVDLEQLLGETEGQLSDTMDTMAKIKAAIDKLRATSEVALETAKAATSRVQMAVSIYELAAKSNMAEEVEILDESQRQVAELRERLKRRH